MSEPVLPYASPARHGLAARDIFGVAVRTVGLLVLLYGVRNLLSVVTDLWLNVPMPLPHVTYYVFSAIYLLVGLSLLRGAWLVRLAYGSATA